MKEGRGVETRSPQKGVRTFVRPEVQRGPAKSGNAQLNIPQRADTEPVRSPVHGRINQYTAGVKEKNGKRKRERERAVQQLTSAETSCPLQYEARTTPFNGDPFYKARQVWKTAAP